MGYKGSSPSFHSSQQHSLLRLIIHLSSISIMYSRVATVALAAIALAIPAKADFFANFFNGERMSDTSSLQRC
jgi:hypothetical protein